MADSTIAKLFVELGFKDKDFKRGLKSTKSGLKNMEKVGQQISGIFGGIVVRAFKAATASITALGAASAVVGAKFEQEITTVAAVSGATAADLERLTNTARDFGSTTTYSATQAATAMQSLARAGMETNEIITATGPALNLAGASGESMSLATESLAATMAQFSLDASEAGRVSDVFAEALRSSLFNLGSLREAMKYAGTVGAGFNMTLEETVAAVAQFRDLGLEGSMAGTQLRMAMSSAARGTERSKEALKKLGLVQAQINPTMNTFSEILKTVGDAGIQADDAIAIFGSRAGSNMALLAKQFAAGGEKYNELLSKLETSTGTAQQMFEEMTDTVRGQFTIARSAMEELLISLFDSYKGPLKDALSAVAEVIQDIATEFKRSSDQIAGTAESVFGSFARDIRANSEEIAKQFVSIIEFVTTLIGMFASLRPIAKELFLIMTAVFAVGQIIVFMAVLGQAVLGFHLLKAAIISTAATLTATTGGLYALVVAVGILITTVGVLTVKYSSAGAAAERLSKAQAEIDKQRAKEDALAMEGAQNAQTITAELMRQKELELKSQNTLTESYSRQLKMLQKLSAEQLRQKELSGEVVRVNQDGQEVFKTTAMLVEEASNASLGSADAAEQLSGAIRNLQQSFADNSAELEAGHAEIDKYEEVLEATGGSVKLAGVELKSFGGSVEKATKQMAFLGEKNQVLTKTFEGLEKNIKETQHSLARGEVSKALFVEGENAEEAAKKLKEYQKALDAARKARKDLVDQMSEDFTATFETETQARRRALDEQVALIEETFAKEIALVSKNKALVETLERLKQDTILQARIVAGHEQRDETQSQVDQLLDIRRHEGLSESMMRAKNRQSQLEEMKAAFVIEAGLHQEGSAERQAVLVREQEALSVLRNQFRAEDLRIASATAKETAEVVAGIEKQVTLENGHELTRINMELADAKKSISKGSADELARVDEIYADRAKKVGQRIKEDAKAITDSRYAEQLALTREKEEALAKIPEEFGEERLAVSQFYDQQMLALKAQQKEEMEEPPEPTKFEAAMKKIGEVGKKTFKGIAKSVEVMKKAVDSAMAGFGKLRGGFETLTGMNVDLMGAVTDVNSSMEKRQELSAQLAAGEISQEDYNAQMADLPSSASEAATSYVTEMVEGAAQMVETLVEVVPVVVDAFVEALPGLVQKVVNAVPVLFDALITALPVIMEAVGNAVPHLINTFAEKLPLLIQAFVDSLPDLVSKIAAALPTLITALADGIGQLVSMLPQFIDAFLSELPRIITALFDALDTIILAIVAALPGILDAIISNLPEIIASIINGLMGFVTMVIGAIPRIIKAVLFAIPKLIGAILNSVPLIIRGFITLLPELVTNLVRIFPRIASGLIALIPGIVIAVINAIPEIVMALVTELIPALLEAIPKLVVRFLKMLLRFFQDVFTEIAGFIKHPASPKKRPKTRTFGDTPGALAVGARGLRADFSPGDFVAAARNPMNLLAQAVSAVGSTQYVPGRLALPQTSGGLDEEALQRVVGAARTTEPLRVTVTAEGRTLDDVLHVASKRGTAPRLSRMVKRATQAGAHVGFDRGRYSPAS